MLISESKSAIGSESSLSVANKVASALSRFVLFTRLLDIYSCSCCCNFACLLIKRSFKSSIIKSDLVSFSRSSLRPLGLKEENLFGIPCPTIIVLAIKSFVKSGKCSDKTFSDSLILFPLMSTPFFMIFKSLFGLWILVSSKLLLSASKSSLTQHSFSSILIFFKLLVSPEIVSPVIA